MKIPDIFINYLVCLQPNVVEFRNTIDMHLLFEL